MEDLTVMIASPVGKVVMYAFLALVCLYVWFKAVKKLKRLSSRADKVMALLSPSVITSGSLYWEKVLSELKHFF